MQVLTRSLKGLMIKICNYSMMTITYPQEAPHSIKDCKQLVVARKIWSNEAQEGHLIEKPTRSINHTETGMDDVKQLHQAFVIQCKAVSSQQGPQAVQNTDIKSIMQLQRC